VNDMSLPPKRRRPKSRKAPDVLDEDPYQWVSANKYTCSCCGLVSVWVSPWRWFGTVDSEAADKVYICSDLCQAAFEEEHGKLTEAAPLVVQAAMVPAAFSVVCPCCDRENDVPNWDQSAPGYFSFDAETIEGPFITCKCGALIEPQSVRTLPWISAANERQSTL